MSKLEIFNRKPDSEQGKTMQTSAPRNMRKYLEGWESKTFIDEKGRVRTKSFYTGDYYTADETNAKNLLRKIAYILAAPVIALPFICISIRNIDLNKTGYVAVCQALALIGLGWFLLSGISYAINKRKMKVYDYKSGSGAIKRSSLIAAIGLALTGISILVHSILVSDLRKIELMYALCMLALAAIMWLIRCWEFNLNYTVTKAEAPNAAPEWKEAFDSAEE